MIDTSKMNQKHSANLVVQLEEEPKTYQQAINSNESKQWRKAMDEEYNSLIGNKTSNMVCKLNKTLYGTKQAPNEWNNEINNFMVNELKFKRCISDTCIYFKQSKNGNAIIVAIFVDDIITAFKVEDLPEFDE